MADLGDDKLVLLDNEDDEEEASNDRRVEHSYSKLETQRILDSFAGSTPNLMREPTMKLPFNQNIWSRTRKIIIPAFIAIGVCALAMMFMGIFGSSISGWISMLALVAMTWFGSMMGMTGSYLFGTISETIGVMKKENDKMGFNISQLSDVRKQLKSTTKGIFYEVGKLQQDSKELDDSLKQFDELR